MTAVSVIPVFLSTYQHATTFLSQLLPYRPPLPHSYSFACLKTSSDCWSSRTGTLTGFPALIFNTDDFDGPSWAVGHVCVSVCWTVTFELSNLWQIPGILIHFDTVYGSRSKVRFIGQGSRSQEENELRNFRDGQPKEKIRRELETVNK